MFSQPTLPLSFALLTAVLCGGITSQARAQAQTQGEPTAPPLSSPTTAGSVQLQIPAAETSTPETADLNSSTLDRVGRVGTKALGPFVMATQLSLLTSDRGGKRAIQGAKAYLATAAATELLKRITKQRRPNGANDKSFPSGHASIAFTSATLLDAYRPEFKGVGYGAATWISLSRVQVRAHYLHDVAAGALLGRLITRQFTDRFREGNPNGAPSPAAPLNAPAASASSLLTSQMAMNARNVDAKDGHWHVGLAQRGLQFSKSW